MNNPVAPEIEFEDLVTVEVPCSINGTYKVAFHTAAFAAWLAGASLEDAFPDTDAIDRNVLVGGPTPAEAEAEAQSYPATVPAFYGREVVEETPEDQAIAEFMREREELKEEAEGWRRVAEILNTTATEAFEAYEEQLEVLRAEVRRTADKVSRQRGALNGLTRLHDENTAIIVQASRYVGQAKELLAELGVNVETEADGRPSLSVNLHHIIGKLSDMTGI